MAICVGATGAMYARGAACSYVVGMFRRHEVFNCAADDALVRRPIPQSGSRSLWVAYLKTGRSGIIVPDGQRSGGLRAFCRCDRGEIANKRAAPGEPRVSRSLDLWRGRANKRELRDLDISIGLRRELPPGRGTAKDGRTALSGKWPRLHGKAGIGGGARLQSKKG